MRNLDLYGNQKVNTELHLRVAVIDLLPSEGEKAARMMAWGAFVDDRLKLADNNELIANLARLKYSEAKELFPSLGMNMDVEQHEFVSLFLDELGVINQKVTKKSVQVVFYIFFALGLFGIYKVFF